MEAMAINHGELVTLEELNPSSPFFKQGASVRVTGKTPRGSPIITATLVVVSQVVFHKKVVFVFEGGFQLLSCSELEDKTRWKLQEYTVETAIAVVADGNATLKIDTQHLRDISFRIGSTYQLIGELLIQPDNEAILQARVGRIVDGIDLSLYHQSLQLLRQFQADHLNNSTS
uniref:CST complex subunit TEN1 n=1 Tax=Salix viminalis TaxID=40686 RepID=A0A6N2KTA1_SALVM